MKPLLTICTPAIFERAESAAKLAEEISNQIAKAKLGPENVEHLVLFDNRSMTVGEKRQRLFDAARGEYVAFVDDDDWILPGYVASVYNAAMKSTSSPYRRSSTPALSLQTSPRRSRRFACCQTKGRKPTP